MQHPFPLVAPSLVPVLDPGFRPPILCNRAYDKMVADAGEAVPVALCLERDGGRVSRFDTHVLPLDHPQAAANYAYIERLVKFLVWQWGGWKLTVGGPAPLGRFLAYLYSPMGPRHFDAELWGEFVHEQPFVVDTVAFADAPPASGLSGSEIHLDWKGWRVGFDLGASDRKVAVVKDGQLAKSAAGPPVFSEEFIWDPRPQTEPEWHYRQINEILKAARDAIKEVDPDAEIQAIGGSSAGVYVDGRVRIASLFRGVEPRSRFEAAVAPLFHRLRDEWGVPFRLENDGDVTALAGAIALNDGAVLGLAMGSSLAAGYVDDAKRIVGWKNELAFAPVDYNPRAVADEWSGDRGVGANYFSQQAVARLIADAGITIDDIPADALPKRLVRVQELMRAGDERAAKIYQTIGRYFGYTVAWYAEFYQPLRHIEVLGRVMSGEGGQMILDEARAVLKSEFPEYTKRIQFYEPNELEKRHGQAAAAASLPIA